MSTTLSLVSVGLIDALTAGVPESPSPTPATRRIPRETFDIRQWIMDHGLPARGPTAWQDGQRWVLSPCPWNADHQNGSAFIVQFANGALAAGCHHNSCVGKDWPALRDAVEPGWRERGRASSADDTGPQQDSGRRSQADLLVALTDGAELFHDQAGDTFARLAVGDHLECWPTRSKGFKRWLDHAFYQRHEKVAGSQAMTDALRMIEARAQYDGPCRSVYVRVAPDGCDGLYLDLGDPTWRVVHVTPRGWVLEAGTGVFFRRSPGMLALPEPVRGGTLDELRDFVNVRNDAAWALVKAWLRAALRDRGPYPALGLYGEQGSAKTSLARMLRGLTDPATPELRSDPRELRDLSIAARSNWLIAFDNISSIQPWLSDALCRLATGGGWATRELYSDFDEVLFDACRPVLLTGITDYITRGDLLDRAIQITLDAIPEERRRDETCLWAEFESARPRLLGALLDDVVAALRTLPSVRLSRLPRMADFSLWAVAAERGRGEPPTFLAAYDDARGQSHEQALEGSVIGPALQALITEELTTGPWRGTVAELLLRLNELADEGTRRSKLWPRSARGLSGELRRLAPALRGLGISVTFGTRGKNGRPVTLEKLAVQPSPPSLTAPESDDRSVAGDDWLSMSDGRSSAGDDPMSLGDGGDGLAAAYSGLPDPQKQSDDDWGEL